jgi:hypothetical protein
MHRFLGMAYFSYPGGQSFISSEILGVPSPIVCDLQEIKGFDKLDFREVISIDHSKCKI